MQQQAMHGQAQRTFSARPAARVGNSSRRTLPVHNAVKEVRAFCVRTSPYPSHPPVQQTLI